MRKTLYHIFTLTSLFIVANMSVSCEKEKQLPPEEEEIDRVLPPVDDIDDGDNEPGEGNPKDYLHVAVFMSVEDHDTDGSGIDLATGTIFRGTEMHSNAHATDLLYMDFGNATNGNLALPASSQLSVSSFGEDIQYGWGLKNEGVLYQVASVNPSEVEWFNGLNSAERIRFGVDSLIAVFSADPARQKKRYRNVSKDQLFIFKSIDRNISSVIYVSHQDAITSGSNARLVVKSDTRGLQEIPPVSGDLLNANGNHYADILTTTFDPGSTAEIFFDFIDKKVYNRADLAGLADLSQIHLLFTFNPTPPNNNPLYNLYTPTSSWIYGGANPNLNSHYGSRELFDLLNASGTNIPTIWFWRIDSRSGYAGFPFEDTRLNHSALLDYYEHWGSLGSWSSNQVRPPADRVFRIRDTSNELYGAFKLLNVDIVNGELSVAVKFYNSVD